MSEDSPSDSAIDDNPSDRGSSNRYTANRSASDDPLLRSRPFLVLEKLLFALPPVIGLGIVGLLQQADQPLLRAGLIAFAAFGAVVIRVGVPLCIFLDGTLIRRRDVEWRPNRLFYTGLALAVSAPAVGLVYLYRRHRLIGTRRASSRWWYLVVASIVGAFVGFVVVAIGLVLQLPRPVTVLGGAVGGLALASFPIAIYEDACYVRTAGGIWRPNPATYLALAFASLLALAILQPVVGTYYLLRRHHATKAVQ